MRREWPQFRLLMRVSLGRLLDTAVASRDTDATQFAIWGFALIATPPFVYGVKMFGKYQWLARRPELLERVAIADRLFFIVYAMLAAALLAAVLWDALFPDRDDQEVIGVLPVRKRTLAAARLATAIGVAIVFSLAMALPSALIYTFNVAAAFRAASIVGWWPFVFVAHVTAMTAAGVFAFAALLAVRGIATLCFGAAAAQRAAALLQLVTSILLVEVFLFLPTVLFRLIAELTDPAHAMRFPPLWFLGLYGTPGTRATLSGLGWIAVGATMSVLALAAAVYVLPARWNARRTLEAPVRDRTGHAIALAQRGLSPLLHTQVARAVFGFTLASLARSRRHALIVATYFGVGLGVAGISLMAATARNQPLVLDQPAAYLAAIPLILTFFIVLGLRAAFAVPTDLEANWTFRVAEPRSTMWCVHAVGVLMVMLAVVPITAAWLIVASTLWNIRDVVAVAIMHLASGAMLAEIAVVDCVALPFTRAHVASSRNVRVGWAFMLVGLHVFAFRLDDLQMAAIGSAQGVALYSAAMIAIGTAARVYGERQRRGLTLRFDAPSETAVETLNLSRALG